MRIVLWSDSHGLHGQCRIPDGDVLIFAGDIGRRGTLEELASFDAFLARLPHPHKLVVAGNRDYFFERQPAQSLRLLLHAEYLQDREISFAGLRIYGSPWQPPFMDTAFNLPRGAPLREKWEAVPAGIDILVTHTPPLGIGDRTGSGLQVGCADLLDAVGRIRPRLHVFGHVHEAFGEYPCEGTLFCNASVTNASMRIAHEPIVTDLSSLP
jgi:Icc-related predicted phosphoesterase